MNTGHAMSPHAICERRSRDTRRGHAPGLPALLVLAALLSFARPLPAADLAGAAKIFLDARVTELAGDVEITIGEPDPRLALAECARAEPFLPPNARLWGKSHVGIRCVQGATWTAYVPITIRVFAPSPVAARPLARGQIVGRDDVRLERVELTQWPPGELAAVGEVDGQMPTRAIAAAEPLRRSLLKLLPLIVPGDPVRVMIETGSFVVSTEGKALTSAGDGEGVQVALSTGKTLWGTASPGKVVQIK